MEHGHRPEAEPPLRDGRVDLDAIEVVEELLKPRAVMDQVVERREQRRSPFPVSANCAETAPYVAPRVEDTGRAVQHDSHDLALALECRDRRDGDVLVEAVVPGEVPHRRDARGLERAQGRLARACRSAEEAHAGKPAIGHGPELLATSPARDHDVALPLQDREHARDVLLVLVVARGP